MQTLRMRIEEPPLDIPFFIGFKLLDQFTDWLREHYPRHSLVVICDDTIKSLYAEQIGHLLGGFNNYRGLLTFPAGESSKNRSQKMRLEDQLVEIQAGRDTLILAMGGGVTGDLAGYVAATYQRGVGLVHLPTSLLAMVDSSIGGKVGINHPAGKNLLGAFYQPRAVFADTAFLNTLPQDEFLNGLGEVVKYALIFAPDMQESLRSIGNKSLPNCGKEITGLIARCAELKMKVVEADHLESGYRSILNFGHTTGHALEKLSGYSLKHGFAVGIGMVVAAWISHRRLGFPEAEIVSLVDLLTALGLPARPHPDITAEAVWQALQTDKKARQQKPYFSLLHQPGKAALFVKVEKKEFCDAFRLASAVH